MTCAYFSVRARKKELLRQIKEYAIDLPKFCNASEERLLDYLPAVFLDNIFEGRRMMEEGERLLRTNLEKAVLYMIEDKGLEEVIEK